MSQKHKNLPLANDLVDYNLVDLIEDRYARFSKYIIQERALPDVRDGLKPVQRRILYAMLKDGNTATKPMRKSAKTVGLVIGNYHPHGDSSVYDAMVRLSQSWKMNQCLIDMQGNNGSIDDDPAAAMRYTEARLAPIAHDLLQDIDEETVDWSLNFSDTELEPVVLPASFCHILVNGATGIASGYATKIPPFNLNEVTNACIYRLMNPACAKEDLFDIIKGPDFPTGGIIQGKEGAHDILEKGQGKIVVRAKVDIKETKKMKQLVITEIPYEVIKEQLVRSIDELRIDDNLTEITDVRDESDRNGISIVIDLKPDSDAHTILNLLYKQTDLQVNYNANMVVIDGLRPRQLGVTEMIDAYLEFRTDVVKKRTQYRLNKIKERLHIIEGLIKAVSILDEVIALIRASNNRVDAKDNLMSSFSFSDQQADSILALRLYRLSNTDIVALKEEFATLLNDLEYLNSILNEPAILKNEMIQEFKAINEKNPTPRKTKLEAEVSELIIDRTAFIPDEEVYVALSREGYVKRSSLRSYQASDQFYTTIKEGDQLVTQGSASLQDTLVYFTNQGNYGVVIVNDLSEHRWKDIGSHISSIIPLGRDEVIINAILVKDFATQQYVLLVSKLGRIKKTQISDFEVTRTSKTYKAINLKRQDELVSVYLIDDYRDILLATKYGYTVRYNEQLVSAQGLNASGVQAIKLVDNDTIIGSALIQDNDDILFVTDKDLVKRIKASQIETTGRPTRGSLIAKRVKSNPNHLKAIYAADLYDKIPLYTIDQKVMVLMKDITLMTKEQTFSKGLDVSLELVNSLELAKRINRIEDETDSAFKQIELDL